MYSISGGGVTCRVCCRRGAKYLPRASRRGFVGQRAKGCWRRRGRHGSDGKTSSGSEPPPRFRIYARYRAWSSYRQQHKGGPTIIVPFRTGLRPELSETGRSETHPKNPLLPFGRLGRSWPTRFGILSATHARRNHFWTKLHAALDLPRRTIVATPRDAQHGRAFTFAAIGWSA